MSTPKEKAKELFDKYLFIYGEYTGIEFAKQASLITVDEVLLHEKNNHSVLDKLTDYWNEVKQEIEKL